MSREDIYERETPQFAVLMETFVKKACPNDRVSLFEEPTMGGTLFYITVNNLKAVTFSDAICAHFDRLYEASGTFGDELLGEVLAFGAKRRLEEISAKADQLSADNVDIRREDGSDG